MLIVTLYFSNLHFPYKIYIGHTPLLLHGIFEFIGVFVAYRYYLLLRKKRGDTIQTSNRVSVIIAAALGAVIGSRGVGSLENLPAWLSASSSWVYFLGNKTLVGGLLGGLAGVELMKKIIGEKQPTGDLFTFPIILGMIIGRIGCFSAGIYEETYGVPSRLPWAMDLGDGIPRHPVTLYEILFLLLLWMALLWIKKNYVLQTGALFKFFLIAYLTFRFCLDLIKPGWRYFLGLGTIQLACVAGLLYYATYIFHHGSLIISKRTNAG